MLAVVLLSLRAGKRRRARRMAAMQQPAAPAFPPPGENAGPGPDGR